MLVGVAAHEDGLEGGELEIGVRMLAYEGHALCQLAGSIVEDVGAIEHHRALLRGEQSCHQPQQGGFATAVCPHHGVEAAIVEVSIEVRQDDLVAKAAGEVLEGYH